MDIEIYFEPRVKFDKRIKEYNQKIFFGRIISSWTADTTIDAVAAKLDENLEVCIITLEDCSGINSHVFENIANIISVLKLYTGINKLVINNPPKFFYDKLIQLQQPIKEKEFSYPKINESQIRKVQTNFDSHIIGQTSVKKALCRKLIAQLIRPSKKPLVLMFHGNPGIGKTETAKYLSKTIYNSGSLLREQMTMVGGESSVKYFKATSHNEDSFSKHLLNRTSNVILLDEFALAPPFFQTTFFQMFDEGVYSDQNFTVDVSNSIIICTSNLQSIQDMEQNIDHALLSRFDGFIHFRDFTEEEKIQIAQKLINEFMDSKKTKKKYAEKIDKDLVLDRVAKKISQLTNVRNIRRYVEDIIADLLMEEIL